jgi:hypothetical protein
MSDRVLIALTCPSCGGPLSVAEGDTHTACPSCASAILLPAAVRSYVLPSSVSGTDALRTVRKKLQELHSRAAGNSRVKSPALFYVPFWHVTCQSSGYVLGLEPVYREELVYLAPDGDGETAHSQLVQTRRKVRKGSEAVEREIQLSGSVNISGADLTPLGIPSLSSRAQMSMQGMAIQRKGLPEGLQVLDRRSCPDGVFVDPTVPLAEAIRQAEEYLGSLASGVGRGLERRWEFAVMTGHRSCLIYYPLWIVDFSFAGKAFKAVVDGVSGQVLRGRFPGRSVDKLRIASVIGILWAGLIPAMVAFFTSMDLSGTGMKASGNCLAAGIMVTLAAGVGSWKLLDILDSAHDEGGDHAV